MMTSLAPFVRRYFHMLHGQHFDILTIWFVASRSPVPHVNNGWVLGLLQSDWVFIAGQQQHGKHKQQLGKQQLQQIK